ncbi:MAG: hypothetical protein PHY18_00115 [Dehalococcoidales bacterium]|nr:hypothetical protein [Dehalococcoidales bacterium]
MHIECGNKAVDKNNRFVGKVEKVILNLLTGEIAYFFVRDENAQRNVLYRPEDVAKLSSGKVKLKFSAS